MEEVKELWGEDDVPVLWSSFSCSLGDCSACGAGLLVACLSVCLSVVSAGRIAVADDGCR